MAAVQLREPRPVPASIADDDTGAGDHLTPESQVTLLELLDRVLEKGVVLAGDITLSVAEVDLIYVGLRVLISSVESMNRWQLNELSPQR